jgi:hypothetical protein
MADRILLTMLFFAWYFLRFVWRWQDVSFGLFLNGGIGMVLSLRMKNNKKP